MRTAAPLWQCGGRRELDDKCRADRGTARRADASNRYMPMSEPTSPPASGAPRGVSARAGLRSFGRYVLTDLLGRSATTMVWAAQDSRTEEAFVLTLPRSAPADASALSTWLDDARQLARLSHPHLAPVVDLGSHEQWPYVACERETGLTLAERLAAGPAATHNEIAGWLCEALDGLAYAHEAGFAHLDLQPHFVLVDERGRVRLHGLGVARRVVHGVESGGPSGLAVSRGMTVDPARLREQRAAAERDVLALGLIAHGVLAGEDALNEADVAKVIDRMTPAGREMVRLPWTTPQPISEVLRTIVNRATHYQPRQRYHSARTLHHALAGWREADARDNGGPIALLLARLPAAGHLPASPHLVAMVTRMARMERQRTSELAELVLLDLALSFELLRLVNSLQVQGTQLSGNGPILTIRRAIAMLGLDGVRRAAGGLRGWPGALDAAHVPALKQVIENARLAGHVAQIVRPAGYDPEVVFLVTLLQNLGRLLVQYHFPEDAEQIRALMRMQPGSGPDEPDQPGMSEQAAAYAVLGCDIEGVTIAVGRHWGLAEEVLHMMRRLPIDRPVHQTSLDDDILRATASAANEIADIVTQQATNRMPQAFEAIAKRYGRVLGLTGRDVHDALRSARHALEHGTPMVDEATDTATMPLSASPLRDAGPA